MSWVEHFYSPTVEWLEMNSIYRMGQLALFYVHDESSRVQAALIHQI